MAYLGFCEGAEHLRHEIPGTVGGVASHRGGSGQGTVPLSRNFSKSFWLKMGHYNGSFFAFAQFPPPPKYTTGNEVDTGAATER